MSAINDLAFNPPLRECDLCPADGCDLTCVWPTDEPQVWEGDNA